MFCALRRAEENAVSAFTDILLESPLATAFGAAGLLCQLIWPIFRARKAILGAQFGIGADYSLQYALLGAWSGAGVAALGALQTALTFFAGERAWLRHSGLLLLPVVGLIGYASWSGTATLLAMTAVTLVMIGRAQRDTLRLRVMLLAAAPFGMGYDILVGALAALAGGIVSAIIAAVMLTREIRARRENLPPQSTR
jgi:hypothetical protein